MKNQLPDSGFVRLPQIIGSARTNTAGLIPISRSAWWAGVKDGRFPQPVKLGPRTTAWTVESIRDLIQKMSSKTEPAPRRVKSVASASELAGQA